MAEFPEARRGRNQPPARRHHTVPRFLLSRFANSKDQIFAFDHEKQAGFITSVSNATVETDFYSIEGLDRDAIERRIAEIETLAADSQRRLVLGDATFEDHGNLLNLLALQATRGRVFRERLTQVVVDQAERRRVERANDLVAISGFLRDEYGPEPTPQDIESFRDELLAARVVVDVPPEYSIINALQAASELFEEMRDLQLHVLECPVPSFVTSDNPVLLVDPPSAGQPVSVAECGLALAIDPWRLLLAVPRRPHLADLDCDVLRRVVNGAARASAKRFTYCHPGDPQDLVRQQP